MVKYFTFESFLIHKISIIQFLTFINCSLPLVETLMTTTTATTRASTGKPVKSFSVISSEEREKLSPSKLNNSATNYNDSSTSFCDFCFQRICTESNITFSHAGVEFNWKVHRLRQYVRYLRSLNSTKIYLNKKIPFMSLPTKDAEWLFELEASDHDMELRVSSEFTTNVDNTGMTFEVMLQLVDGNDIIYPEGFSQKATPIIIDPIAQIYEIEFTWSDFERTVLSRTHSSETNPIELRFVINSTFINKIISSEIQCNYKDSDNDRAIHENLLKNSFPPILANIVSLMKDDKYTDLVIKSGDDEFKVHRAILAYSSPILAKMIFNNTFDKNESLLDLGAEIGSDIVEEIIRYIYTGRIEDVEEIADRIIVAANKYGFPHLKRICESALVQQLRTENAFSMYLLATEVNAENLKRRTFNLMRENKAIIVNQTEDFRKLSVHHPDIMYELFLS